MKNLFVSLLLGFLVIGAPQVHAESADQLRQTAVSLITEQKYTDALPYIEQVLVDSPEDPEMHFYYGFSLIAKANVTGAADERRSLRVRARKAFQKAKDLGMKEPIIEAMLDGIPADGADPGAYSKDAEANRLMLEGEAFYAQGKNDEALEAYQRAFAIDPGIYYAALFSGDVYVTKGELAQAEIWYQKAIKIDPLKETAYRYSATPLMRQKRYDEARDRYIDAFISEPFNKFAISGMLQWAEATNSTVAHPVIEIPEQAPMEGPSPWRAYFATRANWKNEKFSELFPGKTYRHTLAEEAEALRAAIARGGGETKTERDRITKLKTIESRGLLEAYILLARADEGIVVDHAEYLKLNRDKLRRYVREFMITAGTGGAATK